MKKELETLNIKVLSFCDIPENVTEEHYLLEGRNDDYARIHIPTDEDAIKFDIDALDIYLRDEYPELKGTDILIHLDW